MEKRNTSKLNNSRSNAHIANYWLPKEILPAQKSANKSKALDKTRAGLSG
jgi:hypothetical protein